MKQECPVCTYLREQELIHGGRREEAETKMRESQFASPERRQFQGAVNLHCERLYAVWALQVDHERLFHPR